MARTSVSVRYALAGAGRVSLCRRRADATPSTQARLVHGTGFLTARVFLPTYYMPYSSNWEQSLLVSLAHIGPLAGRFYFPSEGWQCRGEVAMRGVASHCHLDTTLPPLATFLMVRDPWVTSPL